MNVLPSPSVGEQEGFFQVGHEAVRELHVVPISSKEVPDRYPDFNKYAGAVVEMTGDLFPGFNRHHFRPVLISCEPDDISVVTPFGLSAVESAMVLRRGSGIIINRQGHVLTADHVVKGQAYSVRRGLERAEARVVAVHPEYDFAVLQTDLFGAPQISLRTILEPRLGEAVFACGFPLRPFLGHSLSITAGLVSGTSGASANSSIWISAPIQKGNSGGPIFDEFGNLLALVNNRLSSESLLQLLERQGIERDAQDGLQLMNFALPVHLVASFLRSHSIEHDQCFFVEDIPEDAVPLRATKIAELARMLCVEVESWETRQAPVSK